MFIMRATILTLLLLLVAVNPFPQDFTSSIQNSSLEGLNVMEFDKKAQESTPDADQEISSTADPDNLSNGSNQVNQVNSRTPLNYDIPSGVYSSDLINSIDTSITQKPPGRDETMITENSPALGVSSTAKKNGQKDAWMIEFGNGVDPETYEGNFSGTQDRLHPPPRCLSWAVLCCDGWWLGEWKLGCSTCTSLIHIAELLYANIPADRFLRR